MIRKDRVGFKFPLIPVVPDGPTSISEQSRRRKIIKLAYRVRLRIYFEPFVDRQTRSKSVLKAQFQPQINRFRTTTKKIIERHFLPSTTLADGGVNNPTTAQQFLSLQPVMVAEPKKVLIRGAALTSHTQSQFPSSVCS